MKLIIVLVAFAISFRVGNCLNGTDDAFTKFKHDHSRVYATQEEEAHRKKVFVDNYEFIHNFNLKPNQTFTLGVNHFADYTDQEFVQYFLSHPIESTGTHRTGVKVHNAPNDTNWRTKSMEFAIGNNSAIMTAVKNQGKCGSGWAFAAATALEAVHAMYNDYALVSLSAQNLIDCSEVHGCAVGDIENAFEYAIKHQGIALDQVYPYVGHANESKCHDVKAFTNTSIASYVMVKAKDEVALEHALYAGPLAATIDASQKTFRFYKSGIYDEPNCNSELLNHGVTITGYNQDNVSYDRYWVVKNSWGMDWGEHGYVRMAREKHNQCGIASHAAYPVYPHEDDHVSETI